MQQLTKYALFLALAGLLTSLYACQSEEAVAWENALKMGTEKALDSFLVAYPSTSYKKQVDQRKAGILWAFAERSNTIYHYKKYKSLYPDGERAAEAETKITGMPVDNIDLAKLTSKTLSGLIHHRDKEMEVIALKFAQIEKSNQGISFIADITVSSNIRKAVPGTLNETDFSVNFEESDNDNVVLNLSAGRVYLRDNKILLESTDPDHYWKLTDK